MTTFRANLPGGRSRPSGFSLIEVMVAVSLLAVIIVGLLAMFFQVQRAFRSGTAQVDLMENGRAIMNLLTRELQEAAASRFPEVANLTIEASGGLPNTSGEASSQDLVGSGQQAEIRINYLKDLIFLSRRNDDWQLTSYRMRNAATGVGSLYRQVVVETTNNPTFLHQTWGRSTPDNSTNFHRVADGVVHFQINAYDSQGVALGDVAGNAVFTNRVMPAYLDIELGVLDPSTVERYQARLEADPGNVNEAKSQYLAKRAGRVQVFRQRVVLRAPASESP